MLLKKLTNKAPIFIKNLSIRGLASDSNKVKKGYIFFAIKGSNSNGEDYINHAIKKGAALIICSKNCNHKSKKVNYIKTTNVREVLSQISSKFYNIKPKNIFAVTGTNGKTSVADLFYQILKLNDIPVASIGTLGIKSSEKTLKTGLTTPDTITLHQNLEIIKKKGIDHVIIEASSHGLIQHRLDHLSFKAGIFTNFSQDHLDYHKTMKAYLNAKMILFKRLLPRKSFMITDSLLKEFIKLKRISINRKIRILDINKIKNKINFELPTFFADFQTKNLLMAILIARICKLNDYKIKKALKKIKSIEGRLDLVKELPNKAKIFIDFAHTPDALKRVLKSFETNNKNISLVFGCGGQRDFKKRPLMAKIAKKYCKKIYVTDDNPRKENPKKIRNNIISKLKGSNYFDISNRAEAIKKAIYNSEPGEIILIAGKGHENFQDYGNRTIKISDKKIVKKLNFNKNKFNFKYANYFLNKSLVEQVTRKKVGHYKINGLSIDSREIKKDNLFLTLKGSKNDGNKFIDHAIQNGASYVISSKKNVKYQKKIVITKNTLKFLNSYANLKRKNSKARFIAITGSAGKTSLKNTLKILLQNYGDTFASPKSYNNSLGVPISLSNLNLNNEFAIFEVGMSKPGEINKLSNMIKPEIGIITNIAEAHIENFKNLKGIAKAKGEIINNITQQGTIILNRDDKFFSYLYKKAKFKKIKVLSFGESNYSDVRLVKTINKNDHKIITIKTNQIKMKLKINNINIYNLLASIAVIKELNLNFEKFLNSLKSLKPSQGRGRIYTVNRYNKRFKLIDESYNANPLSVKNAINNFSQIRKKKFKKYLLLGDMLELGQKSEIYHKNLSKLINSSDIDKVFVHGDKSLFTYKTLKKAKRGNIIQNKQDVDLLLKNIITNNDYLMIKGSNATGLNLISKSMIKGNQNVI